MLLFDRPRQDDDLASAAWYQREASLRRVYVGETAKHPAQTANFNP